MTQCHPIGSVETRCLETDQPCISHDVLPTEEGVRAAMTFLMSELRQRGVEETCCQKVEIATTETLNNIVEHAFAAPAQDGHIRSIYLNCCWAAKHARVLIDDNGAPLPGGELPEGRAADLDVPLNDLPEGGFGWFLIRTLAKTVSYRRDAGRNHVELTFDNT